MDLNAADRKALRARVPEKLRFPADVCYTTISKIAKKWGVSRNQAITLVLARYGMDRINISRSREKKTFRIDVDDYYRATLERLEYGLLDNPDREQPGLFGDCRQFDGKREIRA